MRLLAADTSAAVASVAVFEDNLIIYESTLNNGLTHSENFMPMVENALSTCGFEPASIDYFACSAGPGSFTGIRIGVETIKALAHANNAQCVEVHTIEALARNITAHIVVPIMDARCNQVYTGIFVDGEVRLEQCAIALEELMEKLNEYEGDIHFVGDGVAVHKDAISAALGDRAIFAPANLCLQRASSVGMVALDKISKGEVLSYTRLNPVYLRRPQAEREYDRRNKV